MKDMWSLFWELGWVYWDVGRLQPDALKVNTLIRNAIKILQKIWPWRGSDTRSKCMVTMSPTQRS